MTDLPKSAMIFAAGFGTRMGALTKDSPKPMIDVGGEPMIARASQLVKVAGIQNIVANSHYLHDKIQPLFSDLGIAVNHEGAAILDTGGGLRAALPLLGEGPVITLNPDAIWNGKNPIEILLEAWRPEMQALLMLIPLKNAITTRESGDFSLEHGKIARKGPYLYSGAQIIRTERLHEISDTVFSLNAYWDLLAEDGPIHGLVYDGDWCDVGHPQGILDAEAMLRDV